MEDREKFEHELNIRAQRENIRAEHLEACRERDEIQRRKQAGDAATAHMREPASTQLTADQQIRIKALEMAISWNKLLPEAGAVDFDIFTSLDGIVNYIRAGEKPE